MSRPPILRPAPSPRGIDVDNGQGRYFAPRFADLVDLAEMLARDPDGVSVPGGRIAEGIVEIPGKDRGLARTLVEIPALFAHILGEHQSHYAAEAFLSTAQQAPSLVAHSRRLAYAPDPGVAATGLAAFTVKPGLDGEVPRHFGLQSEPKGEVKSQTYETLEAVSVNAGWNAIKPVSAQRDIGVVFVADTVTLPLEAPHALDAGDIVLLEGRGKAAVCEAEDASARDALTLRRLSTGAESMGTWPLPTETEGYRILAAPAIRTRLFGWNADPVAFPPADLASPTLYAAPTGAGMSATGYSVSGLSSGSYSPGQSLLLDEATDPLETDDMIAAVTSGGAAPLRVASAREAAISFRAGSLLSIPQPPSPPAGFPTTQLVERTVSRRASVLDLTTINGTIAAWPSFPLDAVIHAGWTRELPVSARGANPDALTATVRLDADLSAMRPGRRLLIERVSDGHAAEATLTRLARPVDGAAGWDATLRMENGAVVSDFTLGDVIVYGNTAPVSHGESKSEDIGGSDGVTPHQTFALKSAPATWVPGADGAEIALEVRVNGVLWDLVEDFHESPPETLAAQPVMDADQNVTVRFGGEGRGAVPPAGRRNVTAKYRVGLGRIGDVGAGKLTRIKKASPLLDDVRNPMPINGGADPARAEDMRRQAVRPILTFDRAVSVQDHADLALLFPGIARTAARWLNRGAVELIAADAAGDPPADPAALRAYLDARRDAELPLVLLAPQPVDVAIALRIERARAYLADAVRLTVTEALIGDADDTPGLFTFAGREFSAPQSLSGLYRLVLDLDGVAGVEASRFAIVPDTGVSDILHATERQWLRLQATALEIEVVDPGALVADLGGDV